MNRGRGRASAFIAILLTAGALGGCSSADASAPAASTSSARATVPASQRPTTTPTAPTPPPDPNAFTLVATGDLLIHKPVANRALADGGGRRYDFRRMLAQVKPLVAGADLALCHIETPLSKDDRDISGYPVFNTPHELADAVAWAGYDGCSTASNHSADRGLAGVRDTLGGLDAQHLAHAGTARSATEARRIELHTVRNAVVAHLSYTYGLNGMAPPTPWSVNVISVPRILADAHRARAAGATFVVLSLHWGQEYQSAPTPTQVAQAKALLRSPDVDLILGDHVHVQQPVQRIGDKYVVYGMGNLLSNQSPAHDLKPQTQDGGVVGVHVVRRGARWVADRVTVTATYCQIGPYTVWPVTRALASPSTPSALRAQLTASLKRTKAIYAMIRGGTVE